MKVDRYELEDILLEKFEEIKFKPKVIEDIKIELEKHNILAGKVQRIIDGDIPLEDENEVDNSLLFLICNAVYIALNKTQKFNPEKYFNEREIQIASNYKEYLEKRVSLPLVIKNVVKLGEQNLFSTTIDIKTFVKWAESQLIQYNYESQRPPNERVRKSGKIVKVADVDPSSVKSIRDSVINGKFWSAQPIILNVLKDGNDAIAYDQRKNELVIHSGEIDIVDGFHRQKGFIQAVEINPDIELTIQLVVGNLTIQDARSLVAQVNTYNELDKTYVKAMKGEDLNLVVINNLRQNNYHGLVSEMRDRISPKDDRLALYQIVHQLTLSEELSRAFKVKDAIDVEEVSKYLITFFNYLFRQFPEEFSKENSRKALLSHEYMFIGYMTLAAKMFNNKILARESGKILSNVDFSNEGSFYQDIASKKREMSDKLFKEKIREFFDAIPMVGVEISV